MERLKDIKSILEESILNELDKGIESVNTEDMYKACDMIKDVADALYHCTLVKAMEDNELTPELYRNIERVTGGRMYYTETEDNSGESWKHRVNYYNAKSSDIPHRMEMLEEYTKALQTDLMDMMHDASDNEKQMLRTKLQVMMQKM